MNNTGITYQSPTNNLGITYESPREYYSEIGCKGKKLKKSAKSSKKARKRCEKGAFWGRERAEGRGLMVDG